MKIFDKLNIKYDEKQKQLLLCLFLATFLGTYTHPTILKEIISSLPAQYIAVESLVISITGLLISMMWNGKLREFGIRNFYILAISECTISFLLSLFLVFVYYNVWLFAIATLIYSSVITMFVGKCIMYFKSRLWNNDGREKYDNNVSIVGSISCIFGYILSLIFLPSLKVSLFIWGICCIIDDLGWILLYLRNKNLLITDGT